MCGEVGQRRDPSTALLSRPWIRTFTQVSWSHGSFSFSLSVFPWGPQSDCSADEGPEVLSSLHCPGLLSSLLIPLLHRNNFLLYSQKARALYIVNDPPLEAAKSQVHPSQGLVISTTIVKWALITTYKVLSHTYLVNAF